MVLDLHEEIRHITSLYLQHNVESTTCPEFGLMWFEASLLSMQFVWAVLIYFHTIVMTYNGPLSTALRHTDGVRHVMATNRGAPGNAMLELTEANNVATSLISMQCEWAMVVCFYTITTKCNGPLNTRYCHINSVRCEMVVALLLVSSVQIAPHQPGKLIVASLPFVQFLRAVAMCFYTIDTM